ncbi:hypothetical protein E4U12_008223 [Claviceps purpurea]|nr:hypothetical protein E4U12_008223 [Claviceps purpurea]KAG6304996.1 hypothetical protein E4U45_000868 [Claviceps purpurea]
MAVLDILPALTGRLFEALEIPEAEVEVTLAMARKGLDDPDVHRYFNFYFWAPDWQGDEIGWGEIEKMKL